MPIFEYCCLECGAEFERLIRRPEETFSLRCPSCGARNLEEKISAFSKPSRGGTPSFSNCAPTGG